MLAFTSPSPSVSVCVGGCFACIYRVSGCACTICACVCVCALANSFMREMENTVHLKAHINTSRTAISSGLESHPATHTQTIAHTDTVCNMELFIATELIQNYWDYLLVCERSNLSN